MFDRSSVVGVDLQDVDTGAVAMHTGQLLAHMATTMQSQPVWAGGWNVL